MARARQIRPVLHSEQPEATCDGLEQLAISDTTPPKDGRPLITGLRLLSAAPLAAMRSFYRGLLGLDVLEDRVDCLTIAAGLTPVTFVPAAEDDGTPWYHVAMCSRDAIAKGGDSMNVKSKVKAGGTTVAILE